MKILITGASGYIGSKLISRLLDTNLGYNEYQITAVDNLIYGVCPLIPFIDKHNFTFIKGDVRNDSLLKELVPKHDIIIPLAALVGMPLCDKNPVDAHLINQRHIEIICKLKSKEQRLIFPNSNSAYGTVPSGQFCTEESPTNPISLYGITKQKAEEVVAQTENSTVFRLATVFGSSPRPRFDLLINNLVMKAIKEKYIVLYENAAMRNYCHINDICRGFEHALFFQWDKCKNQIFNLGNDSLNCSKLDLVKKIQEHIPLEIIKAEINSDKDKRDYNVSSQKFYNTGFKCHFDLDYGIEELIKLHNLIDTPVHSNY